MGEGACWTKSRIQGGLAKEVSRNLSCETNSAVSRQIMYIKLIVCRVVLVSVGNLRCVTLPASASLEQANLTGYTVPCGDNILGEKGCMRICGYVIISNITLHCISHVLISSNTTSQR